jgi:hypothetical protein
MESSVRVGLSIFALVLLASTGGCIYNSNYPNVGNWDAAAVEQPQRVRFFYGYVVDVRAVPVVYNSRAQNWVPQGKQLIPIEQAYPETPRLFPRPPGYEDPCPNRVCLGVEYTVMLDKSTTPPDEFLQLGQRPAVIVVQNITETQAAMPKGTRVVVRMVNNSAAEVMAATILPGSVGGMNVENALSAGPMPVPLSYRPVSYAGSGGWTGRRGGAVKEACSRSRRRRSCHTGCSDGDQKASRVRV